MSIEEQTRDIIAKLPKQKQKYVIGKLEGKSGYKAGLAAGYAPSTARNTPQIESPDVKAAFAELVRLKIPAKRIVQRLNEGLNATQTKFFVSNGVVKSSKDLVDFKERREYLSLSAQMGGYYTPKQEMEHTQKLDENTAKRLISMYERLGMEEMDFEQRKALRKSHVTLEVQGSLSEDSASSGDK